MTNNVVFSSVRKYILSFCGKYNKRYNQLDNDSNQQNDNISSQQSNNQVNDTTPQQYINKTIPRIDKVKIALHITWLWAWTGLYMAKAFSKAFSILLHMPNDWLSPIAPDTLTTSNNKQLRILNAYGINGDDITNKVKLLFMAYWENAHSASVHKTDGFDFRKFIKFIESPVMFCSYLISEKNINLTLNYVMDNVQRIFVDKDGRRTYISRQSDLSDRKATILNHVNFTEIIEDNNDEIDDLINSINNEIVNKVTNKTASEVIFNTKEENNHTLKISDTLKNEKPLYINSLNTFRTESNVVGLYSPNYQEIHEYINESADN